jgi:WhiB family redox-sensing transcriptional regulator
VALTENGKVLLKLQTGGLCVGSGIDFFAEAGILVEAAKGVCGMCALREECREYALVEEEGGVWGGMSEGERVAERGRRGMGEYGAGSVGVGDRVRIEREEAVRAARRARRRDGYGKKVV